MSSIVTQLIVELVKKQDEMTDELFAKKLGISRATWSLVRNKKQRPDSRKFIPAVMQSYPEFIPLCLSVLTEKTDPEPQETQKIKA